MVPPVSFDRPMTTRTFVVQMQPYYQSRLRRRRPSVVSRWQLDRNSRVGRRLARCRKTGVRTRIAPLVRGQDVRLLAASAATGIVVAMIVALFDALTVEVVYDWLLDQELRFRRRRRSRCRRRRLILRYGGFNASASTSDEYVRAFHERNPSMPLRRFLASLRPASPPSDSEAQSDSRSSIYAGSALGLSVNSRLGRWLQRDEAKVLMTAGAAAGVAAVFKAPATGVMFAMEAPYREDVTPHACSRHSSPPHRAMRRSWRSSARNPSFRFSTRNPLRCLQCRRSICSAQPASRYRRRPRWSRVRLACSPGQGPWQRAPGIASPAHRRGDDGRPCGGEPRGLRYIADPRARHRLDGVGRRRPDVVAHRAPLRTPHRGDRRDTRRRGCRRVVHPARHPRCGDGRVRR